MNARLCASSLPIVGVARWSATQGVRPPAFGARDSRDRECEVRRRAARGLERRADAARDPSGGQKSSVAPPGHSPRESGARAYSKVPRRVRPSKARVDAGPLLGAVGDLPHRTSRTEGADAPRWSRLAAVPRPRRRRPRFRPRRRAAPGGGLTTIPGRVIRSLVGLIASLEGFHVQCGPVRRTPAWMLGVSAWPCPGA